MLDADRAWPGPQGMMLRFGSWRNTLARAGLPANPTAGPDPRFELSDAVRPSYDLEVVPSAGFRHDVYRDEENKAEVPVLMREREHGQSSIGALASIYYMIKILLALFVDLFRRDVAPLEDA